MGLSSFRLLETRAPLTDSDGWWHARYPNTCGHANPSAGSARRRFQPSARARHVVTRLSIHVLAARVSRPPRKNSFRQILCVLPAFRGGNSIFSSSYLPERFTRQNGFKKRRKIARTLGWSESDQSQIVRRPVERRPRSRPVQINTQRMEERMGEECSTRMRPFLLPRRFDSGCTDHDRGPRFLVYARVILISGSK